MISSSESVSLDNIHYFLAFTEQFAKDIGDDRRPYSLETWESAFEIWNKQNSLNEKTVE